LSTAEEDLIYSRRL